MKTVSDVMTRDVRIASPDQTICEVAGAMAEADVGSLPVGENDRLIGMITDRDIVLRAVAKGRDPKTPVREVMTDSIQYCYEDDDVVGVAENMAHLGVRRLAVLNHDKRLVGIVALSNVANCGETKATTKLLKGVAEPHHENRQAAVV
jgi:CBS domain-containing protein